MLSLGGQLKTPSSTVATLAVGLAYGIVLDLLAWVCAGAGHGTLAPATITSAPLSAFNVIVGLLVSPVLWGIMALLTARAGESAWRKVFLLAAALHYLSATVLVLATESGEWRYVQRTFETAPLALLGWAVVYLGGQVAMWVWQSNVARSPDRRTTA